MNGTIPSCLTNYGHPTFENGPCDNCEWLEVCQKSTAMDRELKAKLLEKIDFCLDIVQGAEAK